MADKEKCCHSFVSAVSPASRLHGSKVCVMVGADMVVNVLPRMSCVVSLFQSYS